MIAHLNQLTLPGAIGFAAIALGAAYVIGNALTMLGMKSSSPYLDVADDDPVEEKQ